MVAWEQVGLTGCSTRRNRRSTRGNYRVVRALLEKDTEYGNRLPYALCLARVSAPDYTETASLAIRKTQRATSMRVT